MILAASMALPPPMAMMQSGWKAVMAAAPSLAEARLGSGATSKKVVWVMPISSSRSVTALV